MLNGRVTGLNFSVDGAYFNADKKNAADDTYYQLNANAQFRLPNIGEKIWFDISYGKTFGRFGDEESFARAGFKWGFNDKSPAKK